MANCGIAHTQIMDTGPELSIEKTDAPHANSVHATFIQVLGPCIVKYRELRCISQAELAAAAAISKSTLNRIERGRARDMKISTLDRICHALGVSSDALLGLNAVNLVRDPSAKGIRLDFPYFSETLLPILCTQCETVIPAPGIHPPADCMLALSESGMTNARLSALTGFAPLVITEALRGAHEARRHRNP